MYMYMYMYMYVHAGGPPHLFLEFVKVGWVGLVWQFLLTHLLGCYLLENQAWKLSSNCNCLSCDAPETTQTLQTWVKQYILSQISSKMVFQAQLALRFLQRFFPQVILPITITIGFIGYSIETYARPPKSLDQLPPSQSVSERRQERLLEDLEKSKMDS